ncbi:MAG: helix-turn-helix domain-containing protein [Pararhodobacter sp.]
MIEAQTTVTLPKLMKQNEVAAYLGVSKQFLERDRWQGATIPYVKIGRGVRYRAEDVTQYVERNFNAVH